MIPALFFPEPLRSRMIQQGLAISEPEHLQPLTDDVAMKLAIQEAYKGLGSVSPNPLVGCVILDSKGRFLSKGFHARVGQAHAEINALKGLTSDDLQGAKVFVTLEPCAHEGRTPSCAKALAQLPLGEVIFGLIDPNPLVAGQGAAILQKVGIVAREYQGLKAELEAVCEHFLWNFRQKKVFISAKVASSLDGQLAMASGESKWITDSSSREIAHILRAAHDAILVGANTVMTDDPSLDVRVEAFKNKKLTVIILDSDALCLSRADQMKLAKVHDPANVYFVISDQISSPPNPWGAQVIGLPAKGLGLNLDLLLTKLWDLGLRSVLVEGGAHVLSSIISEKKAQRLYLFQAPMILGAKSGKAWTEQVSIKSMGGRIALANQQYITLDRDLLVTGTLNR
ncbi:MAG: bifunctional diaminohydroxyphosphoribosylaminopyrimidine deaminase/5-amino-6-(5-phosphoribosylamino)uracil reductase RibD [Pseudobdellovibrionaceae bacterium]